MSRCVSVAFDLPMFKPFVCTQKCPPKKQMKMVDLYGIILDDHPDEQFFDTYFRLNGKEQET